MMVILAELDGQAHFQPHPWLRKCTEDLAKLDTRVPSVQAGRQWNSSDSIGAKTVVSAWCAVVAQDDIGWILKGAPLPYPYATRP